MFHLYKTARIIALISVAAETVSKSLWTSDEISGVDHEPLRTRFSIHRKRRNNADSYPWQRKCWSGLKSRNYGRRQRDTAPTQVAGV
jgi:hypothetical protein